ncbi:rhamnulokinase family protein [Nibricoccus sp. IMCC34717]|uniref:rhamnulokinase n=1 Tax=Nibricoccus sp. IMCC34717 TaxID=3034021 RepID=UPI00384C4313
MKAVSCAAVDLGATSGRVIVGTWKDGRLALREVHRFPNAFRTVGAHAYWDVPGLWAEVVRGLQVARREFPALASVGVDSWAVDSVLVDANGRMVHPVHAYRDERTVPYLKSLGPERIRKMYELTGVPDYSYNTGCQLGETLRALPGLADVATRCLCIADYFNFLLSGKMENEFSLASHTQLLDVYGDDWSREALEIYGVPAHWLGAPKRSPARLGPVRGLPELKGVQSILVPGHDTACAFAAMPAAPGGGDLFLSTGTWSLLGFETNLPLVGEEARRARISNERMGDGSYRPLRSSLGLWLLERTLADFGETAMSAGKWRQLLAAAKAERKPAITLNLADKALFNPPSMRAAIDAQLRRRGSKPPKTLPAYIRLACDSLAHSHAEAARLFSRLAERSFDRMLVVGGGSRNALLCQATADASGLPVVSLSLEGTAVGNLAHQLLALGAVPSLSEFRASLARQLPSRTFTPNS